MSNHRTGLLSGVSGSGLGQSSENADRTLSAGGQVKHTPSTGPQAQIRAPAAHQEHRNGPNPAELPERWPTSGQVPRPRKTRCTSSESPARGVQAWPRRLQTQRQLVPPEGAGGHEGRENPAPVAGGRNHPQQHGNQERLVPPGF